MEYIYTKGKKIEKPGKEQKELLLQMKLEQALNLYKEGNTMIEITQLLGLRYYTLNRYLKKEGVKQKKKGMDRELQEKMVVKCFLDGDEPGEISYNLHMNYISVKLILKKNNLLFNQTK